MSAAAQPFFNRKFAEFFGYVAALDVILQTMKRTASVLAAAALLLAPAAFGAGTPRLILLAQENLDLNADPASPAVVFGMKKGDADPTWDVFAGNVEEGDLKGIVSWQLQLFNSTEKEVAYVQGRGAPPPLINWYGLTNDGYLLPNGFYKARLIWIDESRAVRKTAPISTSLMTLDEMRDFLGTDVTLSHVDAGLIIRIVEGVLFPPGRSNIEPASLPVLAKIALFLKSHPRNQLVVEGFADSQGSGGVNAVVSANRAKAVYDYLLSKGIDPTRALSGTRSRRPHRLQ
jgi:outer membrane protein OmpA-like peptidoglycan-associated protein